MDKKQIINTTYHGVLTKWLLSLGILLLLLHHFLFAFPIQFQMILLSVTLVLTGIPHGALDHLVAAQSNAVQSQSFTHSSFLLNYLSRMLVFGLVWYFFPLLALGVFLLLSAFHFGETDLMSFAHKNILLTLVQLFYGTCILTLLLLTHLDEVTPIVSELPDTQIRHILTITSAYSKAIIGMNIGLLLLFAWIYHATSRQSIKTWYPILFHMLVLVPVLTGLPLLLAFTFYFGCWHSLHSLENIRQFLSKQQQQPVTISWVLKKSIPLTVIAVVFILVLVVLANYLGNTQVFLLGFFIGISILTAPHIQVMSNMYRLLIQPTQAE